MHTFIKYQSINQSKVDQRVTKYGKMYSLPVADLNIFGGRQFISNAHNDL